MCYIELAATSADAELPLRRSAERRSRMQSDVMPGLVMPGGAYETVSVKGVKGLALYTDAGADFGVKASRFTPGIRDTV